MIKTNSRFCLLSKERYLYSGGLTMLVVLAALLASPALAQTEWNTKGGGIWYAPSGVNVGIGTTNPTGILNTSGGDFVISRGGNASNGPHVYGAADEAHFSFYQDNDFSFFRYLDIVSNGSAGGAPGQIRFWTNNTNDNQVGAPAIRVTIDGSGNVGIGTATPSHLLHVAGVIGAEEIIVSSTGADYVFQPGYHLLPLDDVAEYISENHHLPDVPSETEVRQKGMSMGEMQAKLLAKIEELTLHQIEIERENRDMKERLSQLEHAVVSSGGQNAGNGKGN